MTNKPTQDIKLAVIANDISYIKDKIQSIEEKMEGDFVTRQEFIDKFGPIQKIVYGLVSLVLVSVFGALLGLVVLK